METTNKAANASPVTYHSIINATNQTASAPGEKGDQLKNAEQQLMKSFRSYVRYNPWVS
jgi:hypothetical protein